MNIDFEEDLKTLEQDIVRKVWKFMDTIKPLITRLHDYEECLKEIGEDQPNDKRWQADRARKVLRKYKRKALTPPPE